MMDGWLKRGSPIPEIIINNTELIISEATVAVIVNYADGLQFLNKLLANN
jgi:hypothetical protein